MPPRPVYLYVKCRLLLYTTESLPVLQDAHCILYCISPVLTNCVAAPQPHQASWPASLINHFINKKPLYM